MPGLFTLSLQQQLDPRTSLPAVGAKLYFYQGGTSTPLTVYRDYGVSVEHPNPITMDGYGRVPAVFLAGDGTFYRARLTMSDGTLAFDIDGIPVIGPTVAEGGGGGDPVTPVDSRALFATGDILHSFSNGFRDGWARCNGRTIGSASSGATERANADTEALFLHLWQKDGTLAVSGGRGASAAADWAANKTIALPDGKGRALFGLDGMGSGATTGRIPAASITAGGVDTLGSSGGEGAHTLTEAELPAHDHDATATQAAHTHSLTGGFASVASGTGIAVPTLLSSQPAAQSGSAQPAITVDVADAGSGTAHNNIPPALLVTFYIKL